MLTAAGALFSFGHGLFAALATATGYGAYGQLGHGDTTYQLQPKRVEALADERGLLDVAADSSHSLALTAEGALFSFGSSANQQGKPVSAVTCGGAGEGKGGGHGCRVRCSASALVGVVHWATMM